jgi:hypothetical protein
VIPATSGAMISWLMARGVGKNPAVAIVNARCPSSSSFPAAFTIRCASHHHDSAARLFP